MASNELSNPLDNLCLPECRSCHDYGAVALATTLTASLVQSRSAVEGRDGGMSDVHRDLQANGSDLGSLWPEIQGLADANSFADSYLSGRFQTFAAFQSAARDP